MGLKEAKLLEPVIHVDRVPTELGYPLCVHNNVNSTKTQRRTEARMILGQPVCRSGNAMVKALQQRLNTAARAEASNKSVVKRRVPSSHYREQ